MRVFLSCCGLLLLLLVLGLISAQRTEIKRLQIPLNLASPIRFAVLSDIHIVSKGRGVNKAQKFVQHAMAQYPDAILLLGDFVINRKAVPFLKSALQGVQAPLGVFAVLGNHDHWAGAGEVSESLRSLGVKVLVNESTILRKDETTVALVGVDDLWAGSPDWQKAFSDVPKDIPVVLLSHNPDATLFWLPVSEHEKFLTKHAAISKADLQRYGNFLRCYSVRLILSGHTHGGHIWLPLNRLFSHLTGVRFIPKTELGWRHPYGLLDIRTTWVYVTKGVTAGNRMPQWFNAPEIAIVEIH
jgi:predicted MPP superfamily phosphohydrolase